MTPSIAHFNTRHGHATRSRITKEYQAWRGIINRCYRAKTKGYSHYGGRGITVSDRWRNGNGVQSGFECFLEDVGTSPSATHSIDRHPNNDGNYEPENCRWATRSEQASNKRSNRWLTGFGKTQLMEQWAKEYSINAAILYDRVVARGMTIEQAVTHAPVRSKLTADEVLAIRAAYASGSTSQRKLAREYGVSKGNIGFIIKRQWWKHI